MSKEALAEADISRPKAEQDARDHYQQMADLIDMLERAGETEWAQHKK